MHQYFTSTQGHGGAGPKNYRVEYTKVNGASTLVRKRHIMINGVLLQTYDGTDKTQMPAIGTNGYSYPFYIGACENNSGGIRKYSTTYTMKIRFFDIGYQ
jgi:hypothetical protein